ncbi:MAG: glucosamine-6-phosphate deaminase [Clostridia bacterium]
MQIIIKNNAQEIGEVAASIIAEQLNTKKDSIIGFATGSSPVSTYQELIKMHADGKVSFKDMTTFNLDEYYSLKGDDVNSYRYFMMDNLFGKVDVDENKVNFLCGTVEDDESECKNYSKKIDAAGGLDIQILGVGTNGHIGFNEPSESFSDHAFKVELQQSTIEANKIYFEDGNMPTHALTMGIGDIMKSKKIILIAIGEQKAQAVYDMVNAEVSPKCPATILQNHDDVVVILEPNSAKLLK